MITLLFCFTPFLFDQKATTISSGVKQVCVAQGPRIDCSHNPVLGGSYASSRVEAPREVEPLTASTTVQKGEWNVAFWSVPNATTCCISNGAGGDTDVDTLDSKAPNLCGGPCFVAVMGEGMLVHVHA